MILSLSALPLYVGRPVSWCWVGRECGSVRAHLFERSAEICSPSPQVSCSARLCTRNERDLLGSRSFVPDCGRRDSNPHSVTYMSLKHARLPVPPLPRRDVADQLDSIVADTQFIAVRAASQGCSCFAHSPVARAGVGVRKSCLRVPSGRSMASTAESGSMAASPPSAHLDRDQQSGDGPV